VERIGAITMAVGQGHSFESGLAKLREIGFDSVCLIGRPGNPPVGPDGTCPELYPDLGRSDPAHVHKALQNSGLALDAVYVGGIDVKDDAAARNAAQHLTEAGAMTLALGCNCMIHGGGTCGRTRVPTADKETEIKRLAGCMSAAAEAYAGRRLKVGVDVHYRSWVEGLDDCRLLLDTVTTPNAGLCLNIGHLTTVEAYGWLLVQEYPNRMHYVGWKDHSLAPDRPRPMYSVELGKGHSPLALYVRELRAHPAKRVHMINCEDVLDADRPAVLARSLAYLRRLFETGGAAAFAPARGEKNHG
jgi:sugar phosphate isomerase/epimerase